MSNEVQMFSNGNINLPVKQLPNGDILFDAEQSAIGLGLTKFNSIGKEYVRWDGSMNISVCPLLDTS